MAICVLICSEIQHSNEARAHLAFVVLDDGVANYSQGCQLYSVQPCVNSRGVNIAVFVHVKSDPCAITELGKPFPSTAESPKPANSARKTGLLP